MPKLIDSNGNYTFSQYFNFTQPTKEIIAEFGYSYQRDKLNLAQYQGDITYLDFLKGYLERNIRLVNPTVEIAIQEFLIAPIIAEVGYYTASEVYSEYTLNFDNLLKGTLDYYLKKNHCLLVIEAKQADLRRGFTQLAVEMIAVDKYLEKNTSPIYGSITNGDNWKFGILDRDTKLISEDVKLYRIPEELESLVRIITQILLDDSDVR